MHENGRGAVVKSVVDEVEDLLSDQILRAEDDDRFGCKAKAQGAVWKVSARTSDLTRAPGGAAEVSGRTDAGGVRSRRRQQLFDEARHTTNGVARVVNQSFLLRRPRVMRVSEQRKICGNDRERGAQLVRSIRREFLNAGGRCLKPGEKMIEGG